MSDVRAAPWGGLTTAEVAERVAGGRVNRTDDRSARTVADIVRTNVVTRFNAVMAALMAVALALGEWRDALFGFVMVLNLASGSSRSGGPKTDTRSPRADHRAEGGGLARRQRREVASVDVVIDEVFELAPGDQVVVDGIVLHSDGLSVDESLLTGESRALVLLLSMAQTVAVIRLGRRNVLVQRLQAVETTRNHAV